MNSTFDLYNSFFYLNYLRCIRYLENEDFRRTARDEEIFLENTRTMIAAESLLIERPFNERLGAYQRLQKEARGGKEN